MVNGLRNDKICVYPFWQMYVYIYIHTYIHIHTHTAHNQLYTFNILIGKMINSQTNISYICLADLGTAFNLHLNIKRYFWAGNFYAQNFYDSACASKTASLTTEGAARLPLWQSEGPFVHLCGRFDFCGSRKVHWSGLRRKSLWLGDERRGSVVVSWLLRLRLKQQLLITSHSAFTEVSLQSGMKLLWQNMI